MEVLDIALETDSEDFPSPGHSSQHHDASASILYVSNAPKHVHPMDDIF